MAEVTEATNHLSIGEVLGLLLEEFPDVTISKIRFLESQGLISPERTASGYRKFYEPDVELLRVILTEQRENYLPLRVIKDRLETGEIDPTGEHLRPNGERDATPARGLDDADHTPAEVPRSSIRAHPASRHAVEHDAIEPDAIEPDRVPSDEEAMLDEPTAVAPASGRADDRRPHADPQLLPGVLLDRGELCAMVGMADDELTQLEEFGVVTAKPGSFPALYGDDAVAIAKPACEFLRLGLDARHLRSWRTAAEREASLYDQLVTPRYRQRNPESRAEALAQLRRLDALGGALRAALTRQALRHHFEG